MMITVIIYHTISLWNGYGWHGHPRNPSALLEFVCTFLNTIHIYVFTFLSGYIYYVLLTENNKYSHKMSAIQARAKRLLVPYSLTLLMIIPIVCWLEKPSLEALLQKYILGVEPSQLWFLLMLFLVQVTFILLGKCVYDKWKVSLLVMVGIHCFGWLGGVLTKNYFQIWSACRFMIYYFLGGVYRKWQLKYHTRIPLKPAILAEILTFGMYWFSSRQDGVVFAVISSNMAFFSTLTGILLSIALVESFVGTKQYDQFVQTKGYRFFNKYNFTMYLFHEQLIYLSNRIFDPILPTVAVVGINLIVALAGAGILSWLVGRRKTTTRLFGISQQLN